MAVTRIYSVSRKGSTTIRLIDATSQSQALRHVAEDEFDIKVASSKEVAMAMGNGAKVEAAGSDNLELPLDNADA